MSPGASPVASHTTMTDLPGSVGSLSEEPAGTSDGLPGPERSDGLRPPGRDRPLRGLDGVVRVSPSEFDNFTVIVFPSLPVTLRTVVKASPTKAQREFASITTKVVDSRISSPFVGTSHGPTSPSPFCVSSDDLPLPPLSPSCRWTRVLLVDGPVRIGLFTGLFLLEDSLGLLTFAGSDFRCHPSVLKL